jgi:hypothetical protein
VVILLWLVEALWWAGCGLGIWLLTLSAVTPPDLIVATPSAVVCGMIAVVARRAYRAHWRYPSRAAVWAAHLPVVIVTDTARVLALPWLRLLGRRSDEGKFVRVAVAPGADRRSVTRRAAAIVLVSMTPGSYAVHDDPDTGELVVHGVLDGGPSMHQVVTR